MANNLINRIFDNDKKMDCGFPNDRTYFHCGWGIMQDLVVKRQKGDRTDE